jgi:hypothetical protein
MSLSLTAADGGFERSISLSIGEPVRFIHLCEGSVDPGQLGGIRRGRFWQAVWQAVWPHAPPALSALPRTVTLRNLHEHYIYHVDVSDKFWL